MLQNKKRNKSSPYDLYDIPLNNFWSVHYTKLSYDSRKPNTDFELEIMVTILKLLIWWKTNRINKW